MERQQAHWHPGSSDPCAHDAPPWQEALQREADGGSVALTVLYLASFLLLVIAVLYGLVSVLGR